MGKVNKAKWIATVSMDDYDELPQDAVYKKSNFINIFKKWKNNERNEKKRKKKEKE